MPNIVVESTPVVQKTPWWQKERLCCPHCRCEFFLVAGDEKIFKIIVARVLQGDKPWSISGSCPSCRKSIHFRGYFHDFTITNRMRSGGGTLRV